MTRELDHVFEKILQKEAKAEQQRAEIDALKSQILACERELRRTEAAAEAEERGLILKRETCIALRVEQDCANVRLSELTNQVNLLKKCKEDAAKELALIKGRRFSAYQDFGKRAGSFLGMYGLSQTCRLDRAAANRAQLQSLEAARDSLQEELKIIENEEKNNRDLAHEVRTLEAEVTLLTSKVSGLQSQLAHVRLMTEDAEKEKCAIAEIIQSHGQAPRLQAEPHLLKKGLDDNKAAGCFDIELEEEEEEEESLSWKRHEAKGDSDVCSYDAAEPMIPGQSAEISAVAWPFVSMLSAASGRRVSSVYPMFKDATCNSPSAESAPPSAKVKNATYQRRNEI